MTSIPGVKKFAVLALVALSAPIVLTTLAEAADLRIVSERQAHVGEEVILTADPVPRDASVEWAISGDVNPVLLQDGGRRCAFTPINTNAIFVTAALRTNDGKRGDMAEVEITPEEFTLRVKIESIEPVELWNVTERKKTPVSALAVDKPIKLSVTLNPPFKGDCRFDWKTDAATERVTRDSDAGKAEFVIRRSEVGISEITVRAFNAAGTQMGACSSTVNVTLPADMIRDSERTEKAWHDWQSAQELWEQKKYREAVELAQVAFNGAPRDPDIANGLKSMSGQYAQYLRGVEFRDKAAEQRNQGAFADALKSIRLAQVVWSLETDANVIDDLEQKIDEQRVLQQKADWLRDTASAYDQEGLYEEALDYYMQSSSLVPSEAVATRMERIQQRLTLIEEANELAFEGSEKEREGNLLEAIDSYNASIERNPDAALKQHIADLENVRKRRVDRAEALYREGQALQKDGKLPEAITRYQESLILWDLPHARDRIEEINKKARKTIAPATKPRQLEEFGIASQAEAAKLVKVADDLYLSYKLDEAVAMYRKALTIAPSDDLRSWINQLEDVLRNRKQLKTANALVQEGNALYRAGKPEQAFAKYQESLTLHSNAEVEAFLKRNGVAIPVPTPEPAPAPTPAKTRGKSSR